MVIEALLPPGQELTELDAALAQLKAALQVDISLRPITPVEL